MNIILKIQTKFMHLYKIEFNKIVKIVIVKLKLTIRIELDFISVLIYKQYVVRLITFQ